MPDVEQRLSEGQRAVATMDPPADLWERAVERSDHDAVVLDLATERRRRTSLWLAVAAVVVLCMLAGAFALLDDDEDAVRTIDVGPAPQTDPQAPAPATTVSGVGCPFGISGDPIEMIPGPFDVPGARFSGAEAEPGQGAAHATLGDQVVEVLVPGFEVQLEDWNIEDVELDRGTAWVWLDGPRSGPRYLPFVQVGWFPHTGEPCDSFSVHVDGGTVDENRRLAVDIADRMVLPAETEALDLPGAEGGPVAGLTLAGTEWGIKINTLGTLPRMSFSDTTVTWDNGCATVSAGYELDRERGILTITDPTSTDPGCTRPVDPEFTRPWAAFDSVMDAAQIPVSYFYGFPGGTPEDAGPLLTLGTRGDPGNGVNLVPA